MKKIFVILFCLSYAYSFCQVNNYVFIKHDTTLIKPGESEWIIKSLPKNNPSITSEIGKSFSEIILQAIAKGKLKAIDATTNRQVPANKIYIYNISVDTIAVYDNNGNATYKAVQRLRSASDITQLRIFQDWFFDIATGKLKSQIKWIELLEEVHSPSTGMVLGNTVLCRIYY